MKAESIIVNYEDADGREVAGRLPTRIYLCDTCGGRGHRVNPAIDGNGLSREDFDADPDFEEAYYRGRYDVPCPECNGNGRVVLPDWERIESEPALADVAAAYLEQEKSVREMDAIQESERRMGA